MSLRNRIRHLPRFLVYNPTPSTRWKSHPASHLGGLLQSAGTSGIEAASGIPRARYVEGSLIRSRSCAKALGPEPVCSHHLPSLTGMKKDPFLQRFPLSCVAGRGARDPCAWIWGPVGRADRAERLVGSGTWHLLPKQTKATGNVREQGRTRHQSPRLTSAGSLSSQLAEVVVQSSTDVCGVGGWGTLPRPLSKASRRSYTMWCTECSAV